MSQIEKLIVEGFGEVRKNADKYSVFDVIKVCGQQNPHEVWKRLTANFPEVLTKCENLKFIGSGQRNTPVMDIEGILYLLGLLPGQLGKKYREEAANLMLQYLSNPAELAKASIERIKSPEQVEDVVNTALNKYIKSYHPLMDNLKLRGAGQDTYITVNSTNTRAVMGASPQEIKKQRGGITARKNMITDEALTMAFLQEMQTRKLDKVDAQGHEQIVKTTIGVAKKVQSLVEDCSVTTVTV